MNKKKGVVIHMELFCDILGWGIIVLLTCCIIANWGYALYFKVKCRNVKNCKKNNCINRPRCKKTSMTKEERGRIEEMLNSLK